MRPGDRLLTTDEAAAFLRLKRNTLAIYRVHGDGPPFYKIGGRVRYAQSDLERWLAEHRRGGSHGAA